MIEEIEESGVAERAFRASGEYEFRGTKLEPWSFLRKTAGMALGMKYYRLVPADIFRIPHPLGDARPENEPAEIEMYSGLIYDAAVVLWLCHQGDDVCRSARRDPKAFEGDIDSWAEEAGIMGELMADATAVFMRIMSDERVSDVPPVVPGESAGGGASGSPGNG